MDRVSLCWRICRCFMFQFRSVPDQSIEGGNTAYVQTYKITIQSFHNQQNSVRVSNVIEQNRRVESNRSCMSFFIQLFSYSADKRFDRRTMFAGFETFKSELSVCVTNLVRAAVPRFPSSPYCPIYYYTQLNCYSLCFHNDYGKPCDDNSTQWTERGR